MLKVPRIYNAVITSDKELLPSQAFPALSPIFHSLHYPHFANTLYHTIPLNQNPDSYNEAKTIDKIPNQYYDYAKGIPGQPLNKIPNMQTTQKLSPPLFMPNFKPKTDEDMPNVIPNSNFRNNKPDDMRQFYPHYDHDIGQIFNVMNYENKKVYSASSPVSADSKPPTNQPIPPSAGLPFLFPLLNKPATNPTLQPTQPSGYQYSSNSQNVQPLAESESEQNYPDPAQEPDLNQFPLNYNFIKNNSPKDDSIADVPPPPLPVGNSSPQRRNLPVNPSQLR